MLGSVASKQLHSINPKVPSGAVNSTQIATFSFPETKEVNESTSSNTDVWEELAKDYDVRNATLDDINKILFKLADAEEISEDEAWRLSFYTVTTSVSTVGSPVDFSFRTDWIDTLKAKASQQLRLGNLVGHSNIGKAITILSRLEEKQTI